jgi:hypothetical protein
VKNDAVNVLVIFCSDGELMEQLALAAAVGAVQARANIRIRRLPATDERPGPVAEPLARMQREYVPPTTADAIWADAVIIGMNDNIAGLVCEPHSAAAYGRQAATAVRIYKQRARPGIKLEGAPGRPSTGS